MRYDGMVADQPAQAEVRTYACRVPKMKTELAFML